MYDSIIYIYILYYILAYIQRNVAVSLENYKEPLLSPKSESCFYKPHLQNLLVQIVKSIFRCLELNNENIRTILCLLHEEVCSDVIFVNFPLCCSVQKWPLELTHDRRTILEVDIMAVSVSQRVWCE